MLDPNFAVTNETLWRATALLAAIDAVAVPITLRLVPSSLFPSLGRRLTATAAVVWGGLWLWVVSVFWDAVYRFVFRPWSRWLLPIVMAVLFGLAANLIFRFARRSRRMPALLFLLSGAALGPLTHVWAVYRGLMDKPAVLRGASVAVAVLVSFPEYCLYWCAILLIARVLTPRPAVRSEEKAA
jgi:hypothetical protein